MAIPPRRSRRRVTLTDIARACNLAPSTVSRALSNPGRVNSQTYDRIVRTARELGYHADFDDNSSSRFIRGTIALLVTSLTNPFTLDLIRGCHAQAQSAGYFFLLVSSEESVQLELDWVRELRQTVVGMILASPRSDSEDLRLGNSSTPMVLTNREVSWVSSVMMDTPAGMRQALRYLVSLGHERIAYVRGPADSWIDQARYEALEEESRLAGVSLESVGAYSPSVAAGAAAADAVVLTDATSVVFFNDLLALGALHRFAEIGVSVPEEISIIGCDGFFGDELVAPRLTTVAAFGEQLGRSAAELLISHMSNPEKPHQSLKLPSQLIVRESTAPAKPRSDLN